MATANRSSRVTVIPWFGELLYVLHLGVFIDSSIPNRLIEKEQDVGVMVPLEKITNPITCVVIVRSLKKIKVHIGASNFAINGMLIYEGHLITYESKKLKDP